MILQLFSLCTRSFNYLPLVFQVRNLRALQGAGGGGLRRATARQGERDAPPLGRHQQQDRLGQVSHRRHISHIQTQCIDVGLERTTSIRLDLYF